jgi:hypothetical protein
LSVTSAPPHAPNPNFECPAPNSEFPGAAGAAEARVLPALGARRFRVPSAHVDVTDHAPAAFAAFRRSCGVSDDAFLASFAGALERVAEGAGKSAARFFRTRDARFLVKTLRGYELARLRQMLPRYFAHVVDSRGASRLARFCALLEVRPLADASCGRTRANLKLPNLKFPNSRGRPGPAALASTVVVMLNVIGPAYARGEREIARVRSHAFPRAGTSHDGPRATPRFDLEVFDLKGSVRNRLVPPRDMERAPDGADFAVGKDLNFLQRGRGVVAPGVAARRALLGQLRSDAELLASLNIIDYSLLLGVARAPEAALTLSGAEGGAETEGGRAGAWTRAFGGLAAGRPGPEPGHREVYYLGIIDILQPYDWRKVLEMRGKVALMGAKADEISSNPPAAYMERFMRFVEERVVEAPEEVVP